MIVSPIASFDPMLKKVSIDKFILRLVILLLAVFNPPSPAMGQFTKINLPVYPGQYTSFDNRMVDFGNPDHGFFSATVYFSPSSGGEYWFYTTDNGGMTWTKRFSGGSPWFQNYFLTAVNGDTCLIAYGHEMGDYLFRISDSGSVSFGYYNYPNWMEVPVNVSLFTDSVQYYAVKRYGINKYTYSVLYKLEGDTMTGVLQTNRDTLDILKSLFISQDTGFLITKNASNNTYSVIKTTDACNTWQMSFSTASLSITAIDFFNPSSGMISCSEGVLHKTINAGQTWYPVNSGITDKINCLDFVSDQVGYFGGNNGKFFQTTDQGESWAEIASPSGQHLVRLKMFGYGEGYLVYEYGSCYRYTESSSVALLQETGPFLIYPNPANDKVIIEFLPAPSKLTEINLFDVTGKSLYHSDHLKSPATVDLSSFCRGIYILVVSGEDMRWMKKIIVN